MNYRYVVLSILSFFAFSLDAMDILDPANKNADRKTFLQFIQAGKRDIARIKAAECKGFYIDNENLTDLEGIGDLILNSVTYVSARSNYLTSVPSSLFSRFLELDISHNQISELPIEFCMPFTLEGEGYINISHNQLTELPTQESTVKKVLAQKSLKTFNDLAKIVAYHTSILSRFSFISQKVYSKQLNLSHNLLASLPGEIFTSPCINRQLRILDLSHNALKELPDELGLCRALNKLDISNNPELGKIEDGSKKLSQICQGKGSLRSLFLKVAQWKKESSRLNELEQQIIQLDYSLQECALDKTSLKNILIKYIKEAEDNRSYNTAIELIQKKINTLGNQRDYRRKEEAELLEKRFEIIFDGEHDIAE